MTLHLTAIVTAPTQHLTQGRRPHMTPERTFEVTYCAGFVGIEDVGG